MRNDRFWCKVYPDREWPHDKIPCGIKDIKAGDHFGFRDDSLGHMIGSLNQWHYGIATKDSYDSGDGVWVVEANEVRPPALEIS